MPLLMNKRVQKLELVASVFSVIFGTRKKKPSVLGCLEIHPKWVRSSEREQKSVRLTVGFQEPIQGLCQYQMSCQKEGAVNQPTTYGKNQHCVPVGC